MIYPLRAHQAWLVLLYCNGKNKDYESVIKFKARKEEKLGEDLHMVLGSVNQGLRSLTLGWFSHPSPDTKKNLIFKLATLLGRLWMIRGDPVLVEQLNVPLFFIPPSLMF